MSIEEITRETCYAPAISVSTEDWYASKLFVTDEEVCIDVTAKNRKVTVSFSTKEIDQPLFNLILSEVNAKRILQGLKEVTDNE